MSICASLSVSARSQTAVRYIGLPDVRPPSVVSPPTCTVSDVVVGLPARDPDVVTVFLVPSTQAAAVVPFLMIQNACGLPSITPAHLMDDLLTPFCSRRRHNCPETYESFSSPLLPRPTEPVPPTCHTTHPKLAVVSAATASTVQLPLPKTGPGRLTEEAPEKARPMPYLVLGE